MRGSNKHKARLLFVGIVLCSTLLLPKLLGEQASELLNTSQESSEVVLMIAGEEHRYQPRPDLGYVIMAQENADAIASIQRDVSLLTRQEIKYIAGRGRQGLRIIESEQSAIQNEAAIKTLRAQRQIQYVAPLFSCNGSKIVVIPEIVVRVTSGIRLDQLQSRCVKVGCAIIKPMEFTTQEYLLGVKGLNAEAVFKAVVEFNEIDWIEWAAPNTAFQPKLCGPVLPNDEYFPLQWHLHNTGQSGGTPDADINVLEAWELTTGDPNVVVAVLDNGIDTNHPDLINNLVQGYDFLDDDDLPEPTRIGPNDAHGTACAGLIAALGNNGVGVTGTSWNCKIMPIRILTTSTIIADADIATSFRWAATHGADVLSNSWGFPNGQPSPIVHSAIKDVTQLGGMGRDGKGCVVLFAVPNDGVGQIYYPEKYPEVIAVGATDHDDLHWWYSNYGLELDLVAPSGGKGDEDWWVTTGKDWIWTTDITGPPGYSEWNAVYGVDPSLLDYTAIGGTSAATPIAAGVAALILSIEPDLTNKEVQHFLERSAEDLGDPGRDDYYGWGRVDARAALDMVLAKRCDLNIDWKVDDRDIAILYVAIDTNDLSADIAPPAKRDGIVDEKDLELLMQYLGVEIPEPDLIAHWKLDETEGDIAFESIQSRNGHLHGEPLWRPTEGQVDGALELDGIDDFIRAVFVLNPMDGDFSVFTWIKGGAPGQVIISQIDGANWLLADPSWGNLMTELKGTGRGAAALLSQTAVADGDWHCVGFVRDASARILYVDGVEVARDTQTDLANSEGGLYIGAEQTLNAVSFFTGLIDDVRIYNRAINP